MMRFWNQTLQNIRQDPRKDKFVFIINNLRCGVPLSFALGLSPLITEFQIQDKEIIEKEFLNFIKGQEIKKETFIKIGILLKNEEMMKIWKESNNLTTKGTTRRKY